MQMSLIGRLDTQVFLVLSLADSAFLFPYRVDSDPDRLRNGRDSNSYKKSQSEDWPFL